MTAGIVTDSAADLTEQQLRGLGIRMVPLTVEFGREAYFDRVDMSPDAFWERLGRERDLPRTAAPSPEAFMDVYTEILSGGAPAVVSIHLSGALSGTFRNAEAGARLVPGEVRVVDGRSASLGTGLLALWAARAARAGLEAEAVAAGVERLSRDLRVFFSLATLEYLARGGRIGQAARLVGGMLDVKPILQLAGGSVHPLRRVRGNRQVGAGLVAALQESAPEEVGAVAALALGAGVEPELVREVEERVARVVPVVEWVRGTIGPVIGVHAGPGAVGLIVLPLGDQDLRIWRGPAARE